MTPLAVPNTLTTDSLFRILVGTERYPSALVVMLGADPVREVTVNEIEPRTVVFWCPLHKVGVEDGYIRNWSCRPRRVECELQFVARAPFARAADNAACDAILVRLEHALITRCHCRGHAQSLRYFSLSFAKHPRRVVLRPVSILLLLESVIRLDRLALILPFELLPTDVFFQLDQVQLIRRKVLDKLNRQMCPSKPLDRLQATLAGDEYARPPNANRTDDADPPN